MPSFRQFYGSKNVNAKWLAGRILKGKILSVEPETLTAPDKTENTKLVATVQGIDKKVVFNATACDAMAKKFGEDYSKWIGKTIKLSPGVTQMNGEAKDCVVVTPEGK